LAIQRWAADLRAELPVIIIAMLSKSQTRRIDERRDQRRGEHRQVEAAAVRTWGSPRPYWPCTDHRDRDPDGRRQLKVFRVPLSERAASVPSSNRIKASKRLAYHNLHPVFR
jgi:hypothetical protein